MVKLATNYLAPDGFRYGVRFSDGSVATYWNGHTQRAHASEYRDHLRACYPRDSENFALVRRKPGEDWHVAP